MGHHFAPSSGGENCDQSHGDPQLAKPNWGTKELRIDSPTHMLYRNDWNYPPILSFDLSHELPVNNPKYGAVGFHVGTGVKTLTSSTHRWFCVCNRHFHIFSLSTHAFLGYNIWTHTTYDCSVFFGHNFIVVNGGWTADRCHGHTEILAYFCWRQHKTIKTWLGVRENMSKMGVSQARIAICPVNCIMSQLLNDPSGSRTDGW